MRYFYPGFAIVALLVASPVLPTLRGEVAQAQTIDPRKAEAKRLFDQGKQQYETSQFEASIQCWQKALRLFRETKSHLGEGELAEALLEFEQLADLQVWLAAI